MKKKILFLIALSLCIYLVFPPRPSLKQRLLLPSPYLSLSELDDKEHPSIDEILSQPFSYLGKGTQSYVFVSKDGTYVLKFLKQHPTPRFFADNKKTLKHQHNHIEAVKACALSWSELREQTALLYIHLEPTHHLQKTVTLFDRKGKKWEIPLDQTCFLIQKKAELVYPHLDHLLSLHDLQGAKEALHSIVTLFKDLESKGVIENDPVLRKNFGFVGNRAVQIDCGTMKIDPLQRGHQGQFMRSHGMRKNIRHLKTWVEENYPEFIPELSSELEFESRVGLLAE